MFVELLCLLFYMFPGIFPNFTFLILLIQFYEFQLSLIMRIVGGLFLGCLAH